jgi:hypothetical protein
VLILLASHFPHAPPKYLHCAYTFAIGFIYLIRQDLPLVEWLNFLALEINSWSGAAHTWLSVLLLNPDIVRQTRRIPNYVAELFAPRPGLLVFLFFGRL